MVVHNFHAVCVAQVHVFPSQIRHVRQASAQVVTAEPFSIHCQPSELVTSAATRSFIRTDGYVQTFRAGESALNAIGRQKGFTFEFQRQRHVQQVESTTAQTFGVLFGERSGTYQGFVTIRSGFNKPAPPNPSFDAR